MAIATKEQNGYTVITANAERLDVSNMVEMKDAMVEVIEGGKKNIVIDLSPVTFVDSSGLSVIISIFKLLNRLEGTLKLCGLNDQPNELLQITQLHRLFTVVASCDEATS